MRLKLIGLLLLLSVGTGTWYYLDHFHDPKQTVLSATQKNTVLTALLGRNPHLTPVSQPTQWTTYNGAAISFSYPSWATIHPSEAPTARKIIDQLHFSIGEPRTYMTIQVIDFPDLTSINDYPSVSFRRTNSGTYEERNVLLQSHPGIGFIKNQQDGVEDSSFFLIQGKVYFFVATGIMQKDVDALYNHILATVSL